MKKKIRDLTFEEVDKICSKYCGNCDTCPLNLPGDDCYRNNFTERRYMENSEIEVDGGKEGNLERWIKLLRTDGINSKKIVVEEMEEVLKNGK